jgi:hypothetical protein
MGRSSRFYPSSRIVRRRLDIGERLKEGENMATAPTSERNVWFHPATKREADVLAFKLFCLFAFILVGLITGGVL